MDGVEKKQDGTTKSAIDKSMIKYMKKNNNSYNEELVKLLCKFIPDDPKLINVIKKYYDYEIDVEEPGLITENKDQIKKHKKRVLHYQNGFLYLKEEDFKLEIKSYIMYEFKDLNDTFNFWPDFDLNKIKDAGYVVINITTKLEWELWEISSIVDEITDTLGIEKECTYGVTTKKNTLKTRVDVFIS